MWWSFAFLNSPIKLLIAGLVWGIALPVFGAEPVTNLELRTDLPGLDPQNKICPKDLAKEIQPFLSQPQFSHASIAVVVAESENPNAAFLFNFQGDRYFIPASTLKLFTTVATLKILQASDRIPTRILSGTELKNGILNHDLIIEGNGDPSFSSASLKNLVAQLRGKGVKEVRGKLVFSDRLNAKPPIGWEWNDLQEDYAAVPHGFSINRNVLNWQITPALGSGKLIKFRWEEPNLATDWTVENQAITSENTESTLQIERDLTREKLKITGTLNLNAAPELGATSVPDPLSQFSRLFQAELKNQGIEIDSQTISNSQSLTKIYAQVFSPPLKDLIRTINKESDNLYAELLYQLVLKKIGKQQKLWETFWQSLGIPSDRLRIYDGSGLSRHNSILPSDLIKLMQAMVRDRNFRDSLAIAGIDGTLKNRLKNTKTWAKTGSMSGVSVLAGYLQPPEFNELAFVIAINHGSLKNQDNQTLIDAIALTLNRLKKCANILKANFNFE
jgi:serine-type D-Ala-D-Ala carboxypeptidase/endopeptidase (penicillin-binding protein 4)